MILPVVAKGQKKEGRKWYKRYGANDIVYREREI